jgi:hypothetical protein
MKHARRNLFIAATIVAAFAATALADKEASLMQTLTHGPRSNQGSHEQLGSSFEQLFHFWFILRLVIGLVLSVALSLVIAMHPRRSTRLDPLSDLEERKTLVLLGVVGAVVAELVSVDSTMALVVFGIGGLIRFRTVLRNPKVTGKAILVVLLGLACGLGQFATAIFVTAFAWGLIMWLESHLSAYVKVRVGDKIDLGEAYSAVLDYMRSKHCRVKNSMMIDAKHQIAAMIHFPSHIDPKAMAAELKAALPRAGDGCDVEVEVE